MFDDAESVPEEVAKSKRYRSLSGYSIQEVADQVRSDFPEGVDYLVHSLANGPEVTKPLLETSRKGYLAASSSSAYSLVSMVARFGPLMKPGLSLYAALLNAVVYYLILHTVCHFMPLCDSITAPYALPCPVLVSGC